MTAREHGNVGRSFEMRPDTLVKFFARCDAFRKPQRFLDMLRASECDHRGRTGLELQPFPQAAYLEGALQAAQAIDAGAIAQQQTQPQRIPEAILAARTAQVAAYVERHRPAQA
jgi:tRNA nucleotidyltransferase (CCA-adding enzyme)